MDVEKIERQGMTLRVPHDLPRTRQDHWWSIAPSGRVVRSSHCPLVDSRIQTARRSHLGGRNFCQRQHTNYFFLHQQTRRRNFRSLDKTGGKGEQQDHHHQGENNGNRNKRKRVEINACKHTLSGGHSRTHHKGLAQCTMVKVRGGGMGKQL